MPELTASRSIFAAVFLVGAVLVGSVLRSQFRKGGRHAPGVAGQKLHPGLLSHARKPVASKWSSEDLQKQLRAFEGSVPAVGSGPNCSVCQATNCVGWVAHKIETATFGPLLYRGDCWWVQAGSSWCNLLEASGDSLLCKEEVLKKNVMALQEPEFTVKMSFQKEPPAEDGEIDLLRTPSSTPLLDKLPREWPIRVDMSRMLGTFDNYPTQSEETGQWSVGTELQETAQRQLGHRRLPFVKMSMHKIYIKPPAKGARIRFKKTRRMGNVFPEPRLVNLWPGRISEAEADEVRAALFGKFSRDTARRLLQLKYQVKYMNDTDPFPPYGCREVISGRVHVPQPPKFPRLLMYNFAHWSYESFYQIWSARVNADGYIGFVTGTDWEVFQGFAMKAPALLAALEALAPRRVHINPGTCLAAVRIEAAVGNPAPYGLREMVRYVRDRLSLPPEIMPTRKKETLRVTLLLRWPNGTRSISNWREMKTQAEKLGWEVLLPMRPDLGTVSMPKQLSQVLHDTGRSHLVVAIHGAELSVGALSIAPGAIVGELCVGGSFMRHLDFWYSNYAFSSGAHAFRWTLPMNATTFHWKGNKPPSWDEWADGTVNLGPSVGYDDRFPLRKFQAFRELAKRVQSDTEVPMAGWRRFLTKARTLLETQMRDTEPTKVHGLPPDPPPHPAWESHYNVSDFVNRSFSPELIAMGGGR
eukprot:TRINITY_DN47089_c0_g1_i1.p1 TRINITY_DN47089_c0_g1~~TRINITY_DN47089_c0_g1_i1.p1  ORF type:complete len:698 (+),score=175.92 TRINITY_DN47089_c0_g1_i1:81-2174(+)